MSELIIMREWEEKILPKDLAKDTIFLEGLAKLSDRRGGRIFDIVFKLDGRIAVRSRGYVGAFVLKDSKDRNVVLIVEPKMGVRSVIWMLALSEARNFKEVKEIENLISIPTGKESIVDLLVMGVIKKFIEKLNRAFVYGFAELPSVELEESTVVRGRILSSLLPRTLFASITPKIVYEAQYYTTNNIVNRYILDVGYMLSVEGSYLSEIVEDVTVILKALFNLDYVPPPSTNNISIRELLAEVPLDRSYISELLKLATIIKKWLEYGQPPYPGGSVSTPALYINMNNLFENFVRKMMIIAAKWIRETMSLNITVRKVKGNERALVISPRPKAYLKPDIVVEVNDKLIAVGDVKYKRVKDPLRSGSKGDMDAVNQVHTYIHVWDVKKGFLIYPSLNNKTMYESYMLRNEKKLYIVKIHVNETVGTYKELLNSETISKLKEFLFELIKER